MMGSSKGVEGGTANSTRALTGVKEGAWEGRFVLGHQRERASSVVGINCKER